MIKFGALEGKVIRMEIGLEKRSCKSWLKKLFNFHQKDGRLKD